MGSKGPWQNSQALARGLEAGPPHPGQW